MRETTTNISVVNFMSRILDIIGFTPRTNVKENVKSCAVISAGTIEKTGVLCTLSSRSLFVKK